LNEQYKVIITGSNAHLLSRELSTILRGKVYTKEILPLTFKEYLYFKNIPTDKHSKIADFAKYKGYFVDFLTW
jgi:predicted AAA+ superfamily ATPase